MFVLALLCLLTGCESPKSQPATLDQENILCSLDESTQIIMHLLEKNALSTVLEPSEPEAIQRLIKNFSPAELALEAEALNWQTPVVFFFVQKDSPGYNSMHMSINQTALENNGTIKFVEVDADELFKVAKSFDIETLPALLLMNNRAEVMRVEGVTKESLQADIQKLLETMSH